LSQSFFSWAIWTETIYLALNTINLRYKYMKNELLSFIMSSERRKDIIYLLFDETMTLKKLTNHFGVKASGLIPRIRELESKDLIVKDDGKYRLSNKGIILVQKFQLMDTQCP